MKRKKLLTLLLTAAMSFSVLTGCGQSQSSESNKTETTASSETTTKKEKAADKKEAEATQLMKDLTGSYQELWPVILADEYKQTWLDDCKELVGEENAEAAYEKLASMVSGEVYEEDAVKAYADGNGVYDCAFTEGISKLEFDGATSTIKGYDAEDKEVFSHTYHYVGMEKVRGLYEFESDDDNSGEFTYFCIAPDTNTTTYHIELHYGSDLKALGKYDEGNYAYWLASGISTE